MKSCHLGIAAIGRAIGGKTKAKHKIKRVDRFLKNERIPLIECYKGLVRLILNKRAWLKKKKRIYIAVDWTWVNQTDKAILTGGIITCGRCIPIYQSTHDHSINNCEMTAQEFDFVEIVREIVPKNIEVIFILDRGFSKLELMEKIASIGCKYIVRTPYNRNFFYQDKWRRINQVGASRNFKKDYGKVLINKRDRWETRLVVFAGEQSKNPSTRWNLLTNELERDYEDIYSLYFGRMQIEETFRDKKNPRSGMKFKGLILKDCGRYNRLLLIFAFAYTLLTFIGIWAESRQIDRSLKANTSKERTFALWRLGSWCLELFNVNWHKVKSGMKKAQFLE
jgi:hypothetical protein